MIEATCPSCDAKVVVRDAVAERLFRLFEENPRVDANKDGTVSVSLAEAVHIASRLKRMMAYPQGACPQESRRCAAEPAP